jgi:hypothetical protein
MLCAHSRHVISPACPFAVPVVSIFGIERFDTFMPRSVVVAVRPANSTLCRSSPMTKPPPHHTNTHFVPAAWPPFPSW